MEKYTAINDEVQLLGYGESDSYGPWVKFRLNDHAHLDKFRGQQCGTKAKLGKRYALALVEIGDDEKPVEVKQEKKPIRHGELCWHAIKMCDNANFKKYVEYQQYTSDNPLSPGDFLKKACGIGSRKDLDSDMQAAAKFRGLQQQYSTWVAQQGLV